MGGGTVAMAMATVMRAEATGMSIEGKGEKGFYLPCIAVYSFKEGN
jgi:hypothetical protein